MCARVHMRGYAWTCVRACVLQTSQHHQGRGAVSRALGWVPAEAENRRIPLLTTTPTIIKKTSCSSCLELAGVHVWGRTTLSLGEEPLSQRRGRLLPAVSELHQIPERKLRTRRRRAKFKLESYRNSHFIAATPGAKPAQRTARRSLVAVWPRGLGRGHGGAIPTPGLPQAVGSPPDTGEAEATGIAVPTLPAAHLGLEIPLGRAHAARPRGGRSVPGALGAGQRATSRWQTQHSPPGCPPPGWVRGGHWEVPGEA